MDHLASHIRPEFDGKTERIDFQFDIPKLSLQLSSIIEKFLPSMQAPGFGGWSVWSHTGAVSDGWSEGHLAFALQNGRVEFDRDEAIRRGALGPTSSYKVPTEICTDYLAEVMEIIANRGFNPRRARISMIPPGFSTSLHVDARGPGVYGVRLHVPIVTNDRCRFAYEKSDFHMAADGSGYLVRVNHLHRAYNLGEFPRYHLMMDVFDFTGASQFHRFDASVETLQGWAESVGTD